MCCKKSVLKNCPIVTGKTPVLESFFNKAAGLQSLRCFLVNNEKFLRTNLLKEHLRTAASEGNIFVKKRNYNFFHIKIQTRVREKYLCQFSQSCFPVAEVTNNFLVSKLWLSEFHLFLERKYHFPMILCHSNSLMMNHQERITRRWFVRVHSQSTF